MGKIFNDFVDCDQRQSKFLGFDCQLLCGTKNLTQLRAQKCLHDLIKNHFFPNREWNIKY